MLNDVAKLFYFAYLHSILLGQEVDLVDEVESVLELSQILVQQVALEGSQYIDVFPGVQIHKQLRLLLVDIFVVLSNSMRT